jgi:hypothetical protein
MKTFLNAVRFAKASTYYGGTIHFKRACVRSYLEQV